MEWAWDWWDFIVVWLLVLGLIVSIGWIVVLDRIAYKFHRKILGLHAGVWFTLMGLLSAATICSVLAGFGVFQ